SDYYGALANDVSNANFNIIPSNDITVTAPNGGENLTGLSTYTITWTNLPSASGQYQLQYSTNNGSSWTNIVSNITGNAYTWTVPNIPSTQCLVKVIDYVNTCKYDVSNSTFTISPATPILITPNGGEILYSGTSYNITWNAATFFTTVRLDYSIDNGLTWTNITTATSNSGSYNWTVPNVSSTQCLMRASNSTSVTINDISNATFTIKPAVTVITPNGDNGVTIWGGCTVTSITFDRSPAWNTYLIEYSINNGATWTTIINGWVTSANPATYSWNIPNTPSSQVRVRVTPTSVPSYADQSDNTFTITKPVTIIQPNYGGIMQAGTVYPIKWQSDGISNIYDIFYSTNGGASYTNIVMGYATSTNTYSWTVPATVSNNCKIIVRDNINTCKTDTSDQAFIIQSTPPAITLLTPNGQDTLKGCSTYNITWNDSPTIGTYNILYSTNSGSSWNTIVSGYATSTHNYNWIVPNTINSSNVLVRVQSTATTTVYDQSDALLSIVNGTLLATPHSTAICSGGSVQINSSGGSNYSWSPVTALSATNIPNPVATPTANITYTVQSNNGGCILKDTVAVSVSPASAVAGITITASPSSTVCPGTLVTFTASTANGGTTPGYQWKLNGSPVATTATYTNNTLTNGDIVTCVMTSTLGCVVSNTVVSNAVTMNIVSSVTPSVAITTSPSNTICGGNTVTFTPSPTFGGASPTYIWKKNGTNVATTATYTSNTLANGDVITVVMTSNAVCLSTTTATSSPVTMVVNTIPTITTAISGSTVVCANASYTYSLAPVNGASSYSWTVPAGWSGSSTTNTISVTSFTNNGTITVNASNSCGTSTNKTLTVNITAPTVSVAGPTVVCSGSNATLTASGTATSYTWSTSQTTASVVVTPTIATSYTVTGTDVNGCTNTAVKSLAVNALPVVSAGSTSICAGSTTTLTASGASTYTWNTSATGANLVVTPTVTTIYTVTGTSSLSCVNTATASATVNALPSLTVTSATVCAGGTATLTASGASTYSWNTGATGASQVVSPTGNTNYTVTGVSSAGCSKTATTSVVVTGSPTITVTSTTICPGATATITASGASTYTWNTGATSASLVVTPAVNTTYTVTGTSAAGCTNTGMGSVSLAALPVVAVNSPTLCAGASATLTASGATSYTWNTAATGANLVVSPSATTIYTVTGASALGCTNTATTSVVVNALPSVSATSATVCAGNTATLTVTGANTYTWSTGATGTNLVVSPSANTVYTVTGSSASACNASATATVSVNALPLVSANSVTICTAGTATLTASGASTYSWSTGDMTAFAVVNPSSSTVYTVTGTDGAGCSASVTASVNIAGPPSVSVASATICAGATATLTATGAATYTWNTGATGANLIVTPTANTDYTVTGTSAFGCVNTATATVFVSSAPGITVNSATVCAGSTVTLTASGVTSYTWNTGANTSSISVTPTATTIYTVNGNLTGCPVGASSTATVLVNNLPTVSAMASPSLICVGQTVNLTASGSAVNYTWSSGSASSTETVSPTATTVYTVTGTDANNCSQQAVVTVTVSTCTDVQNMLAAGIIQVYPNPASNEVNVESNSEIQSVTIMDALGKLEYQSEQVNSNQLRINIENYRAGIYFVIVRSGEHIRKFRLVKQ
ncbi:MAG: T9SS type A sorting domain-containing protein, partial [Bacteroidetes bacterium]|nr:T9SS type A sorting domain-containing protein [Bacteroidota bacterium]